jgi:hypothetical protein
MTLARALLAAAVSWGVAIGLTVAVVLAIGEGAVR